MTSSSTIFLIDQLCVRHPALTAVKPAITAACEQLISCYEQGGKVLVCGNGGSCADADHIVGELMKSFELKRPILSSVKEKLTALSPDRGSYLAQHLHTSCSPRGDLEQLGDATLQRSAIRASCASSQCVNGGQKSRQHANKRQQWQQHCSGRRR